MAETEAIVSVRRQAESFPAGSTYCHKSSLHGESNLKVEASGLHSWKAGSLMADACQRGTKGTGNSCLILLRGKNNLSTSLRISHKVWSCQSLMWDTEEQVSKANSSFSFTLHWWFLWTVTNLRGSGDDPKEMIPVFPSEYKNQIWINTSWRWRVT